jgi:hypothetical protein
MPEPAMHPLSEKLNMDLSSGAFMSIQNHAGQSHLCEKKNVNHGLKSVHGMSSAQYICKTMQKQPFSTIYRTRKGLNQQKMMLKNLIKKVLFNSSEILFYESRQMQGFIQLLMKPRNTGERWSPEERQELRKYFKYLSLYIQFLIIFLMPGGFFFLPVFSSILDRRRVKRVPCEVPVLAAGKGFNS